MNPMAEATNVAVPDQTIGDAVTAKWNINPNDVDATADTAEDFILGFPYVFAAATECPAFANRGCRVHSRLDLHQLLETAQPDCHNPVTIRLFCEQLDKQTWIPLMGFEIKESAVRIQSTASIDSSKSISAFSSCSVFAG